MHDINEFELLGVPGVFIASDQFIDAAIAQSTSLGFPAMARVFTPHPIQNRTAAEMSDYADMMFDDILAALVDQPLETVVTDR